MRFLALGMLIALAGREPAAAQQSAAADRALNLVGAWQCESDARSAGTWVFARTAEGTMTMRNAFRPAGERSRQFNEVYQWDPRTGKWLLTARLAGVAGFSETATSGPWTADTWIFEGKAEARTASPDSIRRHRLTVEPFRMVYTQMVPGAFRREIELLQDGHWVDNSASTCKRA